VCVLACTTTGKRSATAIATTNTTSWERGAQLIAVLVRIVANLSVPHTRDKLAPSDCEVDKQPKIECVSVNKSLNSIKIICPFSLLKSMGNMDISITGGRFPNSKFCVCA